MRGRFALWPDEVRRGAQVPGGEAFVVFSVGGERVVRDDGTSSPAEFTYVETPNDPLAPMYVVECAHDEGALPRVDAVHVVRRPVTGREVRSADLHRLRSLEDVIQDAWLVATTSSAVGIGDTAEAAEATFEQALAARPQEMQRMVRGLRQRARRRITPTVLQEVASVYREHLPTGAPTKAVGDHFRIAPSTASLYVKRARDEGYDMGGDA